jgi:hypothetical protein
MAQAILDLGLAAAGPGRLAGLGLLLAWMAVPAAFAGLLPRPMVAAGLALALLAELSAGTLLTDLPAGLGAALTILGFASMAWLAVAGALVPVTRPFVIRPPKQ